jgi:ribosomal protein S27AE
VNPRGTDDDEESTMLSIWDHKQQSGALRQACVRCGTHVFVVDPTQIASCGCCGGRDLEPVGGFETPQRAPSIPVSSAPIASVFPPS